MIYNIIYQHISQMGLKKKQLVIIISLIMITGSSKAQLITFQNMYFQNRYMTNPAMAGIESGLNVNLDYRHQWSSFPGTPKTTSLTADYKATNKVGVGLNINDDQAGLLHSRKIVGSYAYHLQLNQQNEHLSFGLSLGVSDSWVNYNNIIGDISDADIALYNQLKPYVDGDLGIAYTGNNLHIGGVIPNLKSAFFKNSDSRFDADWLLFIAMASYKIPLQHDDRSMTLEPLAAFRVVKGYHNIFDAGFNFSMNNYGLYLQGIYHSSKTMGLGIGLDQRTYALNFSYSLETGTLSNYTAGAFEMGLKLRLLKK